MNGAYVHLAINHIPVVAFPIFFLLLLAGMIKNSRDLVKASLVGLVISAIFGFASLRTGGPAARTLFHYPGVSIERARVHEHAEAGEKCAYAGIVVGVLALIGLFTSGGPDGAPKILLLLVLLGSLVVSVGFVRVAHLGGLIRHPEIESAPANSGAMMMQTTPQTQKPQ